MMSWVFLMQCYLPIIHQKLLKPTVLKPKVLKVFANLKVLKVQRY